MPLDPEIEIKVKDFFRERGELDKLTSIVNKCHSRIFVSNGDMPLNIEIKLIDEKIQKILEILDERRKPWQTLKWTVLTASIVTVVNYILIKFITSGAL